MIIGTAGHIDHGKTTLIQALTGVDTDRLQEEKRRGITIELGFAYLPVADGRVLGFVDVPGHEKFVHTMTAGASGMDHALLVIAADDGIMPQTREHLGILQFMGVAALTVALTKTDRVDLGMRLQREAEIRAWLAGTPYAAAALFPLAAVNGQGVAALREHLSALPEKAVSAADRSVRYAIDRCFVLDGSGTTVSGLLHSGTVRTGDRLILSPAGVPVRVRSIHAQNRAVSEAQAGNRCGLVLAGVDKVQVPRGSWLLAAALHAPVVRFDGWLQVAADAPGALREGLEVMLHHGATRQPAKLVLLEGRRLSPGSGGFVQCCMDEPLPLCWHDRLVLRDMSGQHTLAGGTVLDTSPPLRGRKKPQRLACLQALQAPDAVAALAGLLALVTQPLTLAVWSRCMNQPLPWLLAGLHRHQPDLQVLDQGGAGWVMSPTQCEVLEARLQAALTQFHQQQPDEPGLSAERLRRMAFPAFRDELFGLLVEYWIAQGLLERSGSFLHAPGHVLTLNAQEQGVWETLQPHLQAGGFDPPWVRDLARDTGLAEVLVRQVLCKQARRGALHQVVRDLFYTP
ncbi:MAG: selenocysteine-specific translation elongation factor, partial [Thiothrix sp.]|nr:selenocysteine-specific translation elongation factor [Thiothrix sp.]